LTTFQTFGSHNFLFQYGTATKFSELIENVFGFTKFLTESKCYISVLRYVSSNDIVYFSPHALFSQARSHMLLSCFLRLYYSYIIKPSQTIDPWLHNKMLSDTIQGFFLGVGSICLPLFWLSLWYWKSHNYTIFWPWNTFIQFQSINFSKFSWEVCPRPPSITMLYILFVFCTIRSCNSWLCTSHTCLPGSPSLP